MVLECDMYSPLELEDFENHPNYFPGRGLENRYNTVARWRGEEDRDELMLMAHSDTVKIGNLKNWEFKPNTRFFHYVHCSPESEDIKLMLKASREAVGKEPIVCGSCLSDLSVISKYGTSRAYAFGAGRDFSKIGGAHQANEYIECEKLVDYTKTIAAYVLKILG